MRMEETGNVREQSRGSSRERTQRLCPHLCGGVNSGGKGPA